jgi:hypothetical protein
MQELSFRNDILPLKDKLFRLALRITFVQQRDPKLAYDLKEFLSSDPMLNECMKRIKADV